MRSLAAASLVALTLILSGCTGGSSSSAPSLSKSSIPPAPPATATEDTGGIEGRVLTDELTPIVNVDVALIETGVAVKTDAEGKFSYSELPANTYQLAFERTGYEPTATKVGVVAGEISHLNVTLKSKYDASVPRVEGPFIFDGYNQAAVTSLSDIVTSTAGLPVGCSKCILNFAMNDTVVEAVFQLSIRPNIQNPGAHALMGKDMYVQAYLSDDGQSLGANVANDEWANLDVWRWDADTRLPLGDADFPAGKKAKVIWNNYCPHFWVCADQRFQVHYTFFHGQPAPEEYTPIPK